MQNNNDTISEKPRENGPRNLFLLGILSVGVALVTTILSLVIYHNSGDIYLDRSRPGFLPDETEIKPVVEENYSMPTSGNLTKKDLEEYIKYFQENIDMIDDLENPFSEVPLSDESLGIPTDE